MVRSGREESHGDLYERHDPLADMQGTKAAGRQTGKRVLPADH